MPVITAEEFLLKRPIFHTRDFARATGIALSSASRWLGRRKKAGSLMPFTRGVWGSPVHPLFNPLGVVPYLLANEQGYISFLTALQRYGVVSQVTTCVTVATTGHGRMVQSPVGEFQFIRIAPRCMQHDVGWIGGATPYALASAEKALIDCLYVATRRGNQFAHFPEIEWSELRVRHIRQLLTAHAFSTQIDVSIRRRLDRMQAK